MVKQLIYKSLSISTISQDRVEDILLHARRFNKKQNITGLLLFSENVFLQFLEGAPEDIDLVYKRICNDDRHKDIRTLYTGYADTRTYPDWQMMAYSKEQIFTHGLSDVFIIAKNLMDPIADDMPIDVGTTMKSFCDNYLQVDSFFGTKTN